MAGTIPRLPPPGGPAGIVFDAASGAERRGCLSAAGLLASAGLPVRVHDHADAMQVRESERESERDEWGGVVC